MGVWMTLLGLLRLSSSTGALRAIAPLHLSRGRLSITSPCFSKQPNNRPSITSQRQWVLSSESETAIDTVGDAAADAAAAASAYDAAGKEQLQQLNMENLYQEWTVQQDRLLWENRSKPIASLAALLGRGLRGTEQRLARLRDVESAVYQRLFAKATLGDTAASPSESGTTERSTGKLVPASEVLRRIQWDTSLTSSDFSVMHYDRVEDSIVESPLDAANDSISGKATRFIDALPEHRIVGIKYKERVVWDREKRVDHVFANQGIRTVIRDYAEWKREKDAADEQERQRRAQVFRALESVLGMERFATLTELSGELTSVHSESDGSRSMKLETEHYVQSALDLFRQARVNLIADIDTQSASQPPPNDTDALELLSEFVATQFDSALCELVLKEVTIRIQALTGVVDPTIKQGTRRNKKLLPELDENDLTETFVRGSGPGGQKVNKTSNRVVLLHEPTQIRVECQETRSLPQNRKIARQRLREKLDAHYNGQQSQANVAAQIASSKKAKSKARNRARQRQREGGSSSSDEP